MRDNKPYNGWTNYATWLINLELDLTDCPEDKYTLEKGMSSYILGKQIKAYVEDEALNVDSLSSVVNSIVLGFLSDVDWMQIAEHVIDDMELNKEDEEEDDA